MTADQLTELQARIARLHEIADYFTPPHMQAEVAALWADICELIGIEQEALAMERARECQGDFLAELWSPC